MFIFIFVIWRCRIDGVVIDNTYESGFTVNLSIYVIFGVIRTDMLYFCWDFNPHHHAGGDEIILGMMQDPQAFQSTPPRRW